VVVLTLDAVYTLVRDVVGVADDVAERALANAGRVVSLERGLHVFRERDVQAWFLRAPGVVRALGSFYGTAHFVVTATVLVALYRARPAVYRRWRTALASTTVLALAGFALFPLAPPRLLPSPFGFVDTLRDVGGLWNFASGPVASVSNQYAAMPSLHVAWALWSALAARDLVSRGSWLRSAAWAYPVLTVVAIVATGNHYLVDAAGGAVVLGAGLLIAGVVGRDGGMRSTRRAYCAISANTGAETMPP
jgi:hypothetical protein